MQFKYPEILYALFLLIIPIIVHLFQLQRFVKILFTNVKFLKQIEQQTRKSSRLKKWLILAARMLSFACLIIAFSQPYFSKFSEAQKFDTSIYLDNSFSMQAKGENGELFKNATQKIIENLNEKNDGIFIFTNNKTFNSVDVKTLKNELINANYTSTNLDFNSVLLKIKSNNNLKINTLHKTILISDFQNINFNKKPDFTNVNSAVSLLKTVPENKNNVYVDSVFVKEKNSLETTIIVQLKCVEKSSKNIPVSLYNNTVLTGKSSAKFLENNIASVDFTFPNLTNFNGKITIEDDVLSFDNNFYFSISSPEKINVLTIGNSNKFLRRIYTENEFNFTEATLQNLRYNIIENQHVIILNELPDIPVELSTALKEFSDNGGTLVVIPSLKTEINSYNNLFNKLAIHGKLISKSDKEKLITTIHFNHPLLSNVFEKKVTNFQYPTTKTTFQTTFQNASDIVSFDDQKAFINSVKLLNSTFYWIAAPLNIQTSTFTQSPLVVPIFYNFAKQNIPVGNLYYTIQKENIVEMNARILKDEVLKVRNAKTEFIPLQKITQNKVTLNFDNNELESGFYNVINKNKIIKTLAFNYNRNESDLNYFALDSIAKNIKNVTVLTNIDEFFAKNNSEQKINWLFKWFLAFSVLFLLLEMLILKYFKI